MLLTAAFLAYKHQTSSSNLHQSGDRTDNNNNNNRGSTEDLVVLSRRVHSETIGRCFAPSNEDNWDNNNNITGGDERIRRRPEEPRAIPRMEKGERLMANLPPAALEENDHGGDNDQQQQDNIHTPLVSVSSFRNDVRNEWIQAVFGDALYEANTASNRKKKIGLANIAPYTSFEVKLKHPNSNADGGAADHDDATDDRRRGVNNEHNKLGITLKMLTLGLYVRAIQPGSEAACAGIKPNSILISINGLVLLGEQSKTALERLWQYEGYHNSYNNNNNTQQCDDGIKAETTPPAVGIGDDDVIIQESVELVFIKGGQKYSVVFLSNPPYGIDWAPCGNFACIKRNLYPHLNNIPVGAIVAKVGSVQLEDDLDQIRCYEELRNFTSASYRSNVELSFHVCFAPPQTRSAYYERQQQQQNKADSQSKSSSSGAQATTLVEEQQSYHHLHHSKSHRPAVVAQHDGVEVRVHPMIWNPCSGEDDLHPQNHHRAVVNAAGGYLSKLAARVASGELYSLPQDRRRRRRQRAMRRRSQQPQQHVGNTTSGTNTTMQSLLSSFSSPAKQPSSNSNPVARKMIRSCPPLQSPLLDIWSVDDALLYLLEYHQSINSVKGNEAAEGSDWFVRTSSLSSDVASYLLRIIASRNDDRNKKTSTPFTDQAYLMHILNFFCRQQEQQYKVDLFSLLWSENDDEEFGHYYRMELLAQVMDLTELQRKLKMRREALKERELERGFSLPYLASPSRAITSTISTKSTMSMESIAPDGNSSNHIALLAPQHQSSSPVASVIIGSAETAVENMTVSTSARSPTAIDDIAVASPSTEVTASESSTKKKKKTKVSRRLFSFLRKQSKKSSSSRKKLAAVTNTSLSSEHSETKEIQNRLTPDKAPESRNVATNQNGDHNNVAFLSPKSPKRSLILRSPLRSRRLPSIDSGITECNSVSNNVTFSNTLLFLEELLTVCEDINKSLLSLSLTQKIASWALQPWSASKETFLAEVTLGMRQRLSRYPNLPLLDPIDFSHRLKTLDVEQCYILPSAHFPLLLTFDVDTASAEKDNNKGQMSYKAGRNRASSVFGPEKLYRTTVELVQISTREASELSFSIGRRYLINASVAGTVLQSSPRYVTVVMIPSAHIIWYKEEIEHYLSFGIHIRTNSSPSSNNSQTWNSENVFSFASRSSWGPPQTLSLSLTEVLSPNQERKDAQDGKDPITVNLVSSEAKRKNGSSLPHDQSHAVGFCCVDLDSMWQEREGGSSMNCGRESCHVDVWDSSFEFDDHGEIARGSLIHPEVSIEFATALSIDTLSLEKDYLIFLYFHSSCSRV